MRAPARLVLALVVLTACNASTGDPTGVDPIDPETSSESIAIKPNELELTLKPYVSGFTSPLGATTAGNNKWLYVVEQGGLIRIVRDRQILATPFLDVSTKIVSGGEQGLLGLAFHPQYGSNGRFFINYTDTSGDTVVAEYARSARATVADASSEKILLTYDQPFSNHNGGAIAFGPDGYLYIASGDGGGAGDPMGNGQRKDTLLGKLLRIDVDSSTATTPYGIPENNPFAGDPLARAEIWDYGLRNPWRISFDRRTGTLWIADVGQNAWEEINREPAGSAGGFNYGWNVKEGTRCFPAGTDCSDVGEEFTDPITEYNHDLGCSVTGGYVYRGSKYPAMRGGYFFSDFCSGNIWVVKAAGAALQEPVLLMDSGRGVSSFAETAAGELLLIDYGGELLRVTGANN